MKPALQVNLGLPVKKNVQKLVQILFALKQMEPVNMGVPQKILADLLVKSAKEADTATSVTKTVHRIVKI